jgi:predicted short-subunit dehydrogenase-like oxidoreductase (DUF2520 family)
VRLIVVGRGNLGRTLARAFKSAGRPVTLRPARGGIDLLIRSLKSVGDAIVFLTVPDDALPAVAAELARAGAQIPGGVAFVHASGAAPLGALEALRQRHAVGSFHPLQSFPAPRPPESLRGIVVGVDASTPGLRRELESLAREVGASPMHVGDSARVAYHAAAVLASNYVDVLVSQAVRLLTSVGWSEAEAEAGLLPLAEGALANVRKRGAVAALTGPIRRGDVTTVRRHLDALAELDSTTGASGKPRLADLYRMLGLIALGIAEKAGLEPAAARRMHRALTQKAAATRRRRRA